MQLIVWDSESHVPCHAMYDDIFRPVKETNTGVGNEEDIAAIRVVYGNLNQLANSSIDAHVSGSG